MNLYLVLGTVDAADRRDDHVVAAPSERAAVAHVALSRGRPRKFYHAEMIGEALERSEEAEIVLSCVSRQ